MIRFVKGTLALAREGEVVVENHGIGYAVSVPLTVMEALPETGGEIMLYTYMNVREDAIQLFGFLTQEELRMYKLLISVSGVGPKAGLGIIGALGTDDLRYAIMAGDAKAIARAPGIGPKTAGKVILELKDKIEWEEVLPGVEEGVSVPEERGVSPTAENVCDAIEALVVLGYPKTDAARAVRAVGQADGMTVEELLKQSLKNM